jgi:hypothetical protein
VTELLAGLDGFKARVRRIDNRAVFELPPILAQILHASGAALATKAVEDADPIGRPALAINA